MSKMLLICAGNLEKCMLSESGGGMWATTGTGVREIVDLHRAVDLKGRGDW